MSVMIANTKLCACKPGWTGVSCLLFPISSPRELMQANHGPHSEDHAYLGSHGYDKK